MQKVGIAKTPIICFKEDVGMMGYGMYENRVKEPGTGIFCRSSIVLIKDEIQFIFSCVEIAFITPAIRREVVNKCNQEFPNFRPSSLILTAQHTHSAPGGYSEYALYNITVPGFQPFIFDAVVSAVFESIKLAKNTAVEGELNYHEINVDPENKIGFNRSRKSYNANPENKKIEKSECHLGIDDRMRGLSLTSKNKMVGLLNWYGIHSTCIGNENGIISGDNKGFAAKYFEEENKNAIGIFAQGIAGDVSPHYHGPKDVSIRKKITGNLEFEYAKKNGRKQFSEAMKLITEKKELNIKGEVDSEIIYVDFSNITVAKEFSNNCEDAKTSPACHGVSFFNGTPVDGRGLTDALHFAAKSLSSIVRLGHNIAMPFKAQQRKLDWKEKYRIQGNKKILMDASEHRIFATKDIKGLIIPAFADPTIAELKKQYVNGALEEHSWVPHILPIQIVIINELAIIGCPGEFTVTAGKRLEQSLLAVLSKRGVKEVLLSTYSNAYMGYVTTYEEYQKQEYEGGHTIFGQWTLGAFQTKFNELATAMLLEKNERNLKSEEPVAFSETEMSRRTYTNL